MLANQNLDRDLDMLDRHGRVVIVGNRGRIEIDPRKTMKLDLSIRGSSLHNADAAELKEVHAAFRAGLESGYLKPRIAQRMSLAEAPAAHHRVLESGNNGKIVLIP